ncbi:MAG: PQQ-binding-like beta-propeller repeat protein, partial [Fibrobacteres bacterium]|nr:PQQ-binding-like beta-propeller repeat protein [Fibrobacterota bacterium]
MILHLKRVLILMTLLTFSSAVFSAESNDADSLLEAGLMEFKYNRNPVKAAEVFRKIINLRGVEPNITEAARRSLALCLSEKPISSKPLMQFAADTGRNLLIYRDKTASGIVTIKECGGDALLIYSNGTMTRVSPAGLRIWSKTLSVAPGIAVTDGSYIALVESANVIAVYSAADGKLKWRTRFYSSIVSLNLPPKANAVAVLLRNGKLSYCKSDDGTPLWSANVPRNGELAIRAANTKVIVVAEGGRNSHCLSSYDGEPVWSLATHNVKASFLLDDGYVVVGTYSIQNLDPLTGRQRWIISTNNAIASAVHDREGKIAVLEYDGRLSILDASNGKSINTFPAVQGRLVALYDDLVVCLDTRGRFYSWNISGRAMWKYGTSELEKIELARLSTVIAVYTDNNGFMLINPFVAGQADRRAVVNLSRADQYLKTGMVELALKLARTVIDEIEPGNTEAAVIAATAIQRGSDKLSALDAWD